MKKLRLLLLKVFFSVEYNSLFEDELTGIYNRRYFNRNKSKYKAYLFIDIDRFKAFNDSFGHLVGDRVLQKIARELKKFHHDLIRYGGDEFAICLRCEVPQRYLDSMASEIKAVVKKIGIDISVGSGYTLQKADALMYIDKQRELKSALA